jgi:hypothetical protein
LESGTSCKSNTNGIKVENDIPPRDPPQEVLLIHDPMDDSDEMNKKPAAKEIEGKGRV